MNESTEPKRLKNTGIYRVIKACGYSWAGLSAAFRNEAAVLLSLLLCVFIWGDIALN